MRRILNGEPLMIWVSAAFPSVIRISPDVSLTTIKTVILLTRILVIQVLPSLKKANDSVTPSIAVGWVPSSYNWWSEKLPWFTFLKFRGSYGIVGNDQIVAVNDYTGVGRFPYMTMIDNHTGSAWGYRYNGITETYTGADNLKWEVAKKANLGIDAKFFHDKLSFTVDIFRDTRDHIFRIV